ncbi:MAG TPA: CHRD domain-containing protein, partial [Pyrinomonadaceae bacterium]
AHPSSEQHAVSATPREERVAAFTSPRRDAAVQSTSVALDTKKGQEIGSVYEAFLSPHQEPGEEEDTPAGTPKQFKSTAPSVPRSERTGRAHGVLRFTNDLSKVYVEVRVENINPKDVNMFHIHCGKPDLLGPILLDFAVTGDIQKNLADGVFSAELTDADIVKTAQSGHGVTGAFLIGCPVVPGLKDKVKTIAGMEHIARQGELYFNLHTYGQTYYGYMRGMVRPLRSPAK